MSLMNRVARFARSPQGQRVVGKAKRYAQSPEGRAKLDQVRRQLASRGGGRGRPR